MHLLTLKMNQGDKPPTLKVNFHFPASRCLFFKISQQNKVR